MSILIVSANPLLNEVINEIITRTQSKVIELNCQEAQAKIGELKPEVIIIDESIGSPNFENLLAAARNLQKTRTIVLNPMQNEIILLDSRHEIIRKVDDLMDAISSLGIDIHPELDNSAISKDFTCQSI